MAARVRTTGLVLVLFLPQGCVRGGFTLDQGAPDLAATSDSGSAERRDLADLADLTLDAQLPPDTPPPDRPLPDQLQPDSMPPPGGWVTIQPGSFLMGSPTTEPCRWWDETVHSVTLTRKFQISNTEVTQQQFNALMGYNPSYYKSCGSTCPADKVTWHDGAAYCNALSTQNKLTQCYSCSGTAGAYTCAEAAPYKDGKIYTCPGFRLPTEAEWEYAYRAGSLTALYNGPIKVCTKDVNADPIAWYINNSNATPHPVGQKKPNKWGLYDMAGNVSELTNDLKDGDYLSAAAVDPWGVSAGKYRVRRGGNAGSESEFLRAATRLVCASGTCARTGLRPVRTLP